MGRLCRLWRIEETEDHVVYAYGDKRDAAGRVRISKMDGTIQKLQNVPGLSDNDDYFCFLMLAKARLEKCFKSGSYPKETSLAT